MFTFLQVKSVKGSRTLSTLKRESHPLRRAFKKWLSRTYPSLLTEFWYTWSVCMTKLQTYMVIYRYSWYRDAHNSCVSWGVKTGFRSGFPQKIIMTNHGKRSKSWFCSCFLEWSNNPSIKEPKGTNCSVFKDSYRLRLKTSWVYNRFQATVMEVATPTLSQKMFYQLVGPNETAITAAMRHWNDNPPRDL